MVKKKAKSLPRTVHACTEILFEKVCFRTFYFICLMLGPRIRRFHQTHPSLTPSFHPCPLVALFVRLRPSEALLENGIYTRKAMFPIIL